MQKISVTVRRTITGEWVATAPGQALSSQGGSFIEAVDDLKLLLGEVVDEDAELDIKVYGID